MSIFQTTNTKSHLERTIFFDQTTDVARYDVVKYPQFEKLTEKQLSFFWRPEEIDVSRDSKDFRGLAPHDQHIFTSTLKRQILLDSFQGRGPSLAFLPICSLPEVETFIQTWAFFETIHSRSYTHIIRNVYNDPSVVFDSILENENILECAADISKYYDNLISLNEIASFQGRTPGMAHKKALWLCLNAVNALEGIRFYASFAASWNFAELKKMEGNAKIIKLIARDENIHLAATQQLLKILPKDDPDFAKIKEETEKECVQIFEAVFKQESDWAKYLFKDGSMIGLNEKLTVDYLEWIANKRMTAIGLPTAFKGGANPLPWTQKWIAGSDVQVAPQESEITSYTLGAVKQDVTEDSFKGFSL